MQRVIQCEGRGNVKGGALQGEGKGKGRENAKSGTMCGQGQCKEWGNVRKGIMQRVREVISGTMPV